MTISRPQYWSVRVLMVYLVLWLFCVYFAVFYVMSIDSCSFFFFFSSRRRHTRCGRDWSSDVCSSDLVRQVNKLNSDMIRIGQQLLIPSSSRGADAYALSQSQRLQRTQSRERDGNKVSYTVRRGDTFWDIAREHRVSVREVAAWNGMAPGDPLIPGKKLVIWSKTAQPTVASANPARNQAMVRKVGYRVRSGDSLSAIASRFSVNVRDIASWNDLNTNRYLQPGQSLVLYVDIRNSP